MKQGDIRNARNGRETTGEAGKKLSKKGWPLQRQGKMLTVMKKTMRRKQKKSPSKMAQVYYRKRRCYSTDGQNTDLVLTTETNSIDDKNDYCNFIIKKYHLPFIVL